MIRLITRSTNLTKISFYHLPLGCTRIINFLWLSLIWRHTFHFSIFFIQFLIFKNGSRICFVSDIVIIRAIALTSISTLYNWCFIIVKLNCFFLWFWSCVYITHALICKWLLYYTQFLISHLRCIAINVSNCRYV